jgi:hypothetical protein
MLSRKGFFCLFDLLVLRSVFYLVVERKIGFCLTAGKGLHAISYLLGIMVIFLDGSWSVQL